MKNLMYKGLAYGPVIGAAIMGFASLAHAEADPDILAAGAAVATSTKENLVGLVSANIGQVALVFALVLGIYFIMRLFKRAAR